MLSQSLIIAEVFRKRHTREKAEFEELEREVIVVSSYRCEINKTKMSPEKYEQFVRNLGIEV